MAEKPWGWSTRLIDCADVQVDRANVNKGGYCSIHMHRKKSNLFQVISGCLDVFRFDYCGHPILPFRLQPGMSLIVQAGVWHQFHSETGAVVIEVYLPNSHEDHVSPDDIVRYDLLNVGGIEPSRAKLDTLHTQVGPRHGR